MSISAPENAADVAVAAAAERQRRTGVLTGMASYALCSGIAAGETGAASTAALLAAAAAGGVEQLGLGPAATAVCLCTETATDPASFVRIVGSTADEVRARRPA